MAKKTRKKKGFHEKVDVNLTFNMDTLNTSSKLDPRVSGVSTSITDAYSHTLTSDEKLESRIKAGHAGIDLVEWTMREFDCIECEAIFHIKRIVKRSSDIIHQTFSEDQLIIMAFNLYRRSIDSGKIKEAALVLQNIMRSFDTENKGKKQLESEINVKVLEYLPDAK